MVLVLSGSKEQSDPWDERFEQLKSFQKEHGHCRVVPTSTGKDSNTHQLYHWVKNQRQDGKSKAMSEERIQKLNDICFEWSILVGVDWDEIRTAEGV
jgi:hypothetical protein